MKELQRVATVPERIREAMQATGKKQIELAKETGLSHSTISRYLSGIVEPRQMAAIKLAKALDVSEMWLWGYDVPAARTTEQKKNDDLVKVIAQLRKDADFFAVVSQLADLSPEEYASIKVILSGLKRK